MTVKEQNRRHYLKNSKVLKLQSQLRYHKNREAILAKLKTQRADPSHPRKQRERSSAIKAKFGITQVEYLALLTAQGGVCKICDREPHPTKDGRTPFQIDHCHETGRVRGLLCSSCNSGLAKFREDAKLLRR